MRQQGDHGPSAAQGVLLEVSAWLPLAGPGLSLMQREPLALTADLFRPAGRIHADRPCSGPLLGRGWPERGEDASALEPGGPGRHGRLPARISRIPARDVATGPRRAGVTPREHATHQVPGRAGAKLAALSAVLVPCQGDGTLGTCVYRAATVGARWHVRERHCQRLGMRQV